MLDQDALAQLKGLKNQLESEKERAEGVLRGTGARYGFARLDDGREAFVPPDEMLKAFPGDRVRMTLRPGKDKRPVAEIDGLVDSPLGEFTGRCVRKGKALFVDPDLPEVNRWLFLPPQQRGRIEDGDYLHCRLLRHPIRDGRPQAELIARIGGPDDPGIENTYTMVKHGLARSWPEEAARQLAELLAARDPAAEEARQDLSDLAFVSIDSARTQDIDDALYAEVTSSGWLLYVAIADPSAFIDADSPLRDVLRRQPSTVYFHGAVLPMLPEDIAQRHCALVEGERRPALVCRIVVNEDGSVGDAEFVEASIRSRAKLSYFAVDRYLKGDNEALICHATPLEALYQASRCLRAHREATELVMEDRQEYRWVLDERGHVETIEPYEKLQSQRLVEECMIAANRSAAALLAERGAAGPFVVHDGFRRDRLKERASFLQRYLPDCSEADPDSIDGYRTIMHSVRETQHELPLRSMLNRLLTRARLSRKPGAHMGMGLPVYTNCTSPLRKYLDFLVHLQIKAVLRGDKADICPQPELDAISKRLLQLRDVSQEAERWLALDYLQRLAASDPGPWPGRIVHLGTHGFTVRLDANGLEGFVDLRKEKEKFRTERATATIKSKTRLLRVDSPVRVTLAGVDDDTPHLALFRLDPASGLREQNSVARADAPADTAGATGTNATGSDDGEGEPAAADVKVDNGRTAEQSPAHTGDDAAPGKQPSPTGDPDGA
jgi:ribonuclease R